MKKKLTYSIALTICLCFALFIQSCVSSLWSGAGLIYDRRKVMNTLSDYQLTHDTEQALFLDNQLRCHFCHLDVAAFNGDLLIAGHLETEALRQEALERIGKIQGYRRIFKEIAVSAIRTNLSLDSLITAKIRGEIMVDNEIDPRAFKVVTSDQVVYLMGDVMPDQAQWVTDIARNTDDVVRVVKLLKYYHLSDHAS